MLRKVLYFALCPIVLPDGGFAQSQYNGGGGSGSEGGQYNGDLKGVFQGDLGLTNDVQYNNGGGSAEGNNGAQYGNGGSTSGSNQNNFSGGPRGNIGFGGSGFSSSFGSQGTQGGYAGGQGNSGSLEESIPGIPGDDYPIFSQVPETSFVCAGQVDGGYYGDQEADCQAFHICASDGNGGLSRYSFLCPNGTLFQQQYFVCDWWFNVDCSTTEEFYSLNDEIAAEREANSPLSGQGQYGNQQGSQGGKRRQNNGIDGRRGSASSPQGSYSSPPAGSGYSSPNGNFGGAGSGYGSPAGLGLYARNPRGVDLESVLTPPPLPEGFVLESKPPVEDLQ